MQVVKTLALLFNFPIFRWVMMFGPTLFFIQLTILLINPQPTA